MANIEKPDTFTSGELSETHSYAEKEIKSICDELGLTMEEIFEMLIKSRYGEDQSES